MRVRNAAAGGFTLLEMVIAIAILSILVVMAVPVVRIDLQRQKETELRQALRDIRTAIDAYKRASDEGRIARRADETGYPHTLEELSQGVPNAKDPKGRSLVFLRRIPRDPMQPEPGQSPSQAWGKRSYDSPPDEPVEGTDIFDVYSLADGVGINGVPYGKW
jgi:general secretion pathway protein G